MLYKVIGADGIEYGPATLEVVRQWLAQGRVNFQTRVQRLGDSNWLPLSAFPEFGASAPPQVPPPAPGNNRLQTNPMAQAGFIFGLLSMTLGWCCCYGVPFNLLGLIFSIIGIAQINARPWEQQGRGLAITGLVLSSLSLALSAIAWLWQGALIGAHTVHPRMWHI